jgi:hypothetical protein
MSDTRPPKDEWQAAGEAGERAVKDAVCAAMLAHATGHHHPATFLAVAFGAIVAVAEAARACGASSGHAVMEEYLVAHVRGAMRGADGPVHEDGQPYEGTANA